MVIIKQKIIQDDNMQNATRSFNTALHIKCMQTGIQLKRNQVKRSSVGKI